MKKIDLTGLKNEIMQEIDFMNGYCHYLALGMADEYGCQVALWLDYDDNSGKQVLIHSFAVLGNSVYFDAEGVFTDLRERIDEFEYNYEPDVVIIDKNEAKKILKGLKIPYGKTDIKRFIREKIRNHKVIFRMRLNDGVIRLLAYKGEIRGRDIIMVSQVDSKGLVGKYISSIPLDEFINSKKLFSGVIKSNN